MSRYICAEKVSRIRRVFSVRGSSRKPLSEEGVRARQNQITFFKDKCVGERFCVMSLLAKILSSVKRARKPSSYPNSQKLCSWRYITLSDVCCMKTTRVIRQIRTDTNTQVCRFLFINNGTCAIAVAFDEIILQIVVKLSTIHFFLPFSVYILVDKRNKACWSNFQSFFTLFIMSRTYV